VLGFGETTVNLCMPGQGTPSAWNSEMTLVSSSSSNRLVMNFCSDTDTDETFELVLWADQSRAFVKGWEEGPLSFPGADPEIEYAGISFHQSSFSQCGCPVNTYYESEVGCEPCPPGTTSRYGPAMEDHPGCKCNGLGRVLTPTEISDGLDCPTACVGSVCFRIAIY
jgi:hypothetical protein